MRTFPALLLSLIGCAAPTAPTDAPCRHDTDLGCLPEGEREPRPPLSGVGPGWAEPRDLGLTGRIVLIEQEFHNAAFGDWFIRGDVFTADAQPVTWLVHRAEGCVLPVQPAVEEVSDRIFHMEVGATEGVVDLSTLSRGLYLRDVRYESPFSVRELADAPPATLPVAPPEVTLTSSGDRDLPTRARWDPTGLDGHRLSLTSGRVWCVFDASSGEAGLPFRPDEPLSTSIITAFIASQGDERWGVFAVRYPPGR